MKLGESCIRIWFGKKCFVFSGLTPIFDLINYYEDIRNRTTLFFKEKTWEFGDGNRNASSTNILGISQYFIL